MQTSPELEAILIGLKSLGAPFFVTLAGAVLLGSLLKVNDGNSKHLKPQLTAVLVLLGVLGGFAAMNYERWQFPPAQTMDWLPISLIATFVVLLPLELLRSGGRVWLAAQVLIAILSARLVLPPAVLEQGLTGSALSLTALALAFIAVWRYLDRYRDQPRCGIALMLTSGALAIVVSLGGSIVIGGVANNLMGALAAWMLLSVVGGWIPFSRALIGSLSIMFCMVLASAFFYAEISPILLGVVVLGLPFAQLTSLIPEAGQHRPWRELMVSGFATLLPLFAAVGFVIWNYFQQGEQRMAARVAATRDFYAVLSPEQRKVFDESFHMKRGHHGKGKRDKS